jgi:hypothetical protein
MTYLDTFSFDDSHISKLKEFVRENLAKATLQNRKTADRIKAHIRELSARQTTIIKKNLSGIISDSVLRQQLEIVEREILDANAALVKIPDSETDYEEALGFVEDYLMRPSETWERAHVGVKLKLQWFQFPLGIVYENNSFGTTKVANIFKAKTEISGTDSPKVTSRELISNQLADELRRLWIILKDEHRS